MDYLEELQKELEQLQSYMQIDAESGRGVSAEDVHAAGELMARIDKIRLLSEGAN